MRKRVLSLALAFLLLVMVPAETVMAMPSASTPEVTEEPTEEPVATQEPTAEPEITQTPEETPVAEVTEEPTEEPVATQEPTAEPEVTQAPEETPVAEMTEEPTEEPVVTETPTAEPEVSEGPMDVIPEGTDLTAKVVGTNGIEYEGVGYLSLQTINGLPDNAVEKYIDMCDAVATWMEAGTEIYNVAITADEERLMLSVSVPNKELFTKEVQEQFLLSEQEEEFLENASPEETQKTEVELDDVEKKELDTLLTNTNYFRNQLSDLEKKIYDKGKGSITAAGKNKISYTTNRATAKKIDANALEIYCDVISALINTYPNKTEWYDTTALFDLDITSYIFIDKEIYDCTLPKSPYFTTGLETQAKAKIQEIVSDAKDYVNKYSPQNPTYGMVEYFDKWLCDNNDYDYKYGLDKYEDPERYYYSHSSYGVLLEKDGVCESYARAMTRLLDAAGIRNMYVTGDTPNGGHAWNYVQMPDGKWYMVDSTWNETGETTDYLLCADDGEHYDLGMRYAVGRMFEFATLSTTNYNMNYEKSYVSAITLNENELYLKPETKYQLKLNKPNSSNIYYKNYFPVWKSDNTKVAKVDKNGKITVGKTPGKATITYTVAGQTKTCNVCVYKFTGLTFGDNNKSTFSQVFANPSTTIFDKNISKTITIKQSNKTASAWAIMNAKGLAKPSVTSSNKKVAEAVISGTNMNNPNGNDTITLVVKPKKIGTTKITVKFGGKTATYNLTVKYKINESWFDYSKIVDQTYSGKAYKPKVTKTKDATVTVPADLKYTVSYKNNINAGTATVTIKGTGNYADTITKNFKISPKDLNTCKFTASTKSKSYNGKAQKAVTTVKDGKKILKAGTNYEVQYDVNGIWTATAPANTGIYKVRIVGKGNYTGTVDAPNTYEIKQIPLSKMVVSCPKEVKWKNGKPVTPPVKVKIGSSMLAAGPDYAIGYYKITKNSEGAEVRTAVSSSALCDKGNYVAVITRTKNGTNIDWGSTLTIEKKFKIKKMS